MAAKKVEVVDQKMVSVTLPKARKDEQNFQFVSVNGKNYKVMRSGKPVMVPREVAEVILHSDEAKDEADSYIEAIVN